MEYNKPLCYKCSLFRSAPKTIGGKATCSAYPNGIPKKIFFEGGNCFRYPSRNPKKVK